MAAVFLHLALAQNAGVAATYYCDPVSGNTTTGNGSATQPWGTLQSAVTAGKLASTVVDGDTIRLRTGFHGRFHNDDFTANNSKVRNSYVHIEADTDARPTMSQIMITGASYWSFKGISFSPDHATPSLVHNHGGDTPRIASGYNCHHLTFEDCEFFTIDDASAWTNADWTNHVWESLRFWYTHHMIVRRCTFRNIEDGPHLQSDSLMEQCTINGFCNNGMWMVGPNTIVQDNVFINAYANTAGWHMDFIQGPSGENGENCIVRRNYCNASLNPLSPNAQIGQPQGIFLEWGNINNTRIENNVVLCGHNSWGIVLNDGDPSHYTTNTHIVNNTIYKPYGFSGPFPYINIRGHTIDTTIVRNNITSQVARQYCPNPGPGYQEDHNLSVSNPSTEFVDYPHGDMRPSAGSRFVDAGEPTAAPANDLNRGIRPAGAAIDIGAYEQGATFNGNRAPVMAIVGGRTVKPGSQLSFSLGATDPDDDPLIFAAEDLPTGATFSGRDFAWTPGTDQIGTHWVTFTVSDGKALDYETVAITVTLGAANRAPTLATIGRKTVEENARLTFSISATDPDGDSIVYSARDLPSGASFSGQTFTWTPAYGQAGTYQVTFVASDGQTQDTETVTITVANVNRPPVLSGVGDRSVVEGSSLAFMISATDPDGDGLTYSASGLPSGATLKNGAFAWTPTTSQIGVYDVTFKVSDGQMEDTETIMLAVLTSGPDTAGPTVTSAAPTPDAIQVPLNHLIKLQLSDFGTGVDAQSVVIRLDDQIIYQGDTDLHTGDYGRCSRTGSQYRYRFIFQPNESFPYDRTATVEVDAADLAGNGMETFAYSFLTEMRSFGSNHVASGAGTTAGPKGRPATVSDDAGEIWAVWHSGAAGDRDIYVATLTAGGRAFAAPLGLTSGATDQCNPDIALAADGRLYVVWQDRTRGNWDIVLSISSDGLNWSRPIPVTDSDGNETNPVVAVDRQSPHRAYVAWQDDRNGNSDIYVAVSANAFSESTITRVTSNAADQTEPDIAAYSDSAVALLWTDMRNGNPDLYGASSSMGWTNVPVVTQPGAQTSPALAGGPNTSVLHLLWVDDRPGDRDVYYASFNGLPSTPVSGSSIIDDTSGADQFAPALACLDSSRVFACWEDQRHGAQVDEDSDLYMAELGAGATGTNIFVGDAGTNSRQREPAIGIDGYGNPYVVWTDGRGNQDEIYYAATTFISPSPLDSKHVTAAAGATVGTNPANIASENDVSIIVPPGACQFDARITIAEIMNPQALPVECLGSYDFGPSGIDFDTPVTVTIPYQFTGAGGSAKPYWYDSLTGALSQQGITDVENLVISPNLNALRFKTTHFTPFYLVASDADLGSLDSAAGGCSIYSSGAGSARDIVLPYGLVAIVMAALRRADRKRRNTQPGAPR